MVRTVVAGIDGSPESRAAAEWAAHEAQLRALPLNVVHVREPVPDPMAQGPLLGAETQQHRSERRVPRGTAEDLAAGHPGIEVTQEQLTGRPAEVLADTAEEAALLVLASRGMSGIGGFLVGSVDLAVIAHTEVPVVLVRATEHATDETVGEPSGTVLLGLDADSPDDALIEFAFEEAARRGALRVVHVWNLPSYYAYSLAAGMDPYEEVAKQRTEMLAEVLEPWGRRFPGVEVVAESVTGGVADTLVEASREASLAVVGRRVRRNAFGSHIGSVTHAVPHHSPAPVAVVAHD